MSYSYTYNNCAPGYRGYGGMATSGVGIGGLTVVGLAGGFALAALLNRRKKRGMFANTSVSSASYSTASAGCDTSISVGTEARKITRDRMKERAFKAKHRMEEAALAGKDRAEELGLWASLRRKTAPIVVPQQRIIEHDIVEKPIIEREIVDRPYIVERPIEKRVVVDRPVDRPVYIDRPIEKRVVVDRPVDRPVYINRPIPQPVYVDRPIPQPVVVEKPVERRVVVDRPVPQPYIVEKPVERRVIVDRPVDRPVYVEKRVPQPVLIEKQVEKPVLVERPEVIEETRRYIHPDYNFAPGVPAVTSGVGSGFAVGPRVRNFLKKGRYAVPGLSTKTYSRQPVPAPHAY